uniref:Cytochrome P450, putative n=1 Tax=Ixodes scapularis TaxID=6945 RepID=A0A1S4M0Y8_IXOSC
MVFLLSFHLVRFYRKVSKYPKGPFPLPLVGNLLSLRGETPLHLKAEQWHRRYGDPFTMWMGEKPMVMLNSYQVLREAFVDKRHEFAGRFPTKIVALIIKQNTPVNEEAALNISRQTPPTLQDKEKLPFTVACLYETLRFYPILPMGFPHNTACDTHA